MIGCCRVRIVTLITSFLQVVPLLVVGGRVGSGFFLPVGVGYSCRRSGLPKMGLLADLISHNHIITLPYLNEGSLKIMRTVPLILNAVEKKINKMYKMHNRIKILFLKMNSAEKVLG